MKITKLPDKYEPNKILKEKVIEKCRICPCCGESKLCTLQDELDAINEGKKISGVTQFLGGVAIRRFGFQKPWYKHILQGKKWWNTLEFECETCGARWESDEFPDIEYEKEC